MGYRSPGGRKRSVFGMVQLAGVLVLGGAAITSALSSGAGAAGTGVGASGNVVQAIVPVSPFTAGIPFSSGQGIDVTIPANTVLTPGATIFLLECAAPNGLLPAGPSDCDGNTVQGPTVTVDPNGGFDYVAQTGFNYPVYSLPNSAFAESLTHKPVCGLGAANECVLYIGQNQNDFTQPHFFSQVFQITATAGNTGANPGDGSPPPVTGVSPSLSTVTPATQTVTANGADPATVTVTLLDASSAPVSGKTVTLTASGGTSKIAPPVSTSSGMSNVTDTSGKATFTVTDAAPESVTYTATDSTDPVTVTQTAKVTFAPQVVSPDNSKILASPSSVPADGTTTSTVTVTLLDSPVNGLPHPVSGHSVTLTPNGGSSHITPNTAVTTDSAGQAAFTVTDTTPEVVGYTAKDTTANVTVKATASVTFGTLTLSTSASTVVAVPPTATTGPTGGSTVTVTLLASDGKSPLASRTVTLATSPSATIAIVPQSAGSDVTNIAGKAIFTVTDTVAETVSLTAIDVTDAGQAIAQKPNVVFQLPAAPTVSASLSTVTANSPTVPADGSTAVVISVIVRDTAGHPMAGQVVTITGVPSADVVISPVLTAGVAPGTTDSSGQVKFAAHDEKAEPVVFTAVSGGVTISATASATFVAGQGDANQSTVAANPTQVAADGTATSSVTVTVLDHFANPVAGKVVTLSALSGGSSALSPAQATSDKNGVAVFTVKDAKEEVVVYQATETTDNVVVVQTAAVTFGHPPPPLPVVADSTVVSDVTSVAADGKTGATIIVGLRDANGYPVANKVVTLAAGGGSSAVSVVTGSAAAVLQSKTPWAVTGGIARRALATVPPLAAVTASSTTNSNGDALFVVTDTTVESVTYSATDTTDNLPLSGSTVTISFTTPATPTTTTTTTGPVATGGGGAASGGGTAGGGTGSGATSVLGTLSASPSDSSGGLSDTASGATLAFTGSPGGLPWIFGGGAFLLLAGTLGRRRFATGAEE